MSYESVHYDLRHLFCFNIKSCYKLCPEIICKYMPISFISVNILFCSSMVTGEFKSLDNSDSHVPRLLWRGLRPPLPSASMEGALALASLGSYGGGSSPHLSRLLWRGLRPHLPRLLCEGLWPSPPSAPM